ncbi:MAG: prolyl oligopeptidase family serine peptidase [Candidatus Krumholzibacteriota bacterium]|nr:prolyl oligopeptidase family serine peptidase [Candidatus Krumholzibacteriota bacterium]
MRTGRFLLGGSFLLLLLAGAATGTAAAGQNSGTGAESASCALTVADVVNMESVVDFDISPSGSQAAWVKFSPDSGQNRMVGSIYLRSFSDTAVIRLTRGPHDAHSPRFSPDGSALAFITRGRDKGSKVFLYDLKGGAPRELIAVKAGISSYAWRGREEILFTAPEDSTFRESRLRKNKDDVIVVADQVHFKPVRLFSLKIKTRKLERLTVNPGVIREFAVSPDGKWAVTSEMTDINYPYDHRIPPTQFLLDLSSGERVEIFSAPHLDPSGFKWSPEGGGFYCRRTVSSDSSDSYVGITQLYYCELPGGKLRPVTGFWANGMGGSYFPMDGGVLVNLAAGSRNRPAWIKKGSRDFKETLLDPPPPGQIRLLAAQGGGDWILYLAADASTVPEVRAARLKKGRLQEEKPFISLNDPLRKKWLARSEVIKWVGARQETVEGILYYPRGYQSGTRYPLVVSLHGGPAGADIDFFSERWSNYPHLLSARGTFILKVNYHGSGNFGLEWVESIKGHYYEYEVPDILSGIDYLVQKGLVDEGRVGIMGWSNGSILAIECCLRSEIFKVLCAGAGDVNWTSDYGNCAFGAGFDNAYFGGPPWERPETYIEKSPLFRLPGMKTPTLIMFGTEDTNVPTQQGWEHFRALQQIGKAPVRFLLFPGAGHGPVKLSHRKRKMEEELAWFDRWFFDSYRPQNEAFDEESPLGWALARAELKRSEGLLGELSEGILAPETAAFRKMFVGRYEVTRAQFRQFDPTYAFPVGTGNYPANRITISQAQGYCDWLSEKTGRSFRLPSAEEMDLLLAAVESQLEEENNLEYWTGHTLTPDEMELIAENIARLEESRLLLTEAALFKPLGKEGIYDLGGNVAEWTVDKQGGGLVRGISAVSSRDPRNSYSPPGERYTGFRVVEER